MQPEDAAKTALFERIVTPHVPAAWNLARWLVRNAHDAEDIVQEADLRAFRSIDDYRGGDAKSWFLAIVRNLCHSRIRQQRASRTNVTLDPRSEMIASNSTSALDQLEQSSEAQSLRCAIEQLPDEYREALVLRQFEGL